MALPDFTMRQLLEAGVHFGHKAHRWNPKMAPYIYGERHRVHIIDLSKTVPLLHQALKAVSDTVAAGGRVLFVGTKRQAAGPVGDAAKRSAQYCVDHCWLGGMLTNWNTVSRSIKRLCDLDELLGKEAQGFTKKEHLKLMRRREKLGRALNGIREMGGIPDLLFIIDTNKEQIALKEAVQLRIPVAAIVDTNSDPEGITYPIPGNDDASRSIALYCDLVARAAVDGLLRAQGNAGGDIGVGEALPDVMAGSGDVPGFDLVEPHSLSGKDRFVCLTGPDGPADDLTAIPGISGDLEQKLHALGVFHYWQIAALQPGDIVSLAEKLGCGDLIEQGGWVPKAAALAAA